MKRTRIISATATALAATFLAAVPTSEASPNRDSPHCLHHDGAVDLNELHQTMTRIVTDFCTTVSVGEWWIPAAAWGANTTYEVVPSGYVPAAATPIEDFESKVTEVRYVVDAGKRQERTYRYDASEVIQTGLELFGFPLAGLIVELHPLSRGPHTVDVYLTLTADHWDGFGDDPAMNLVPAGETHWSHADFTVER